VSPLQ
jgi:magnesium-transporting ATPase (P-type)